MKKPGRTKTSPYVYDRAAIRYVLETEGRDAALARWPRNIVDVIARVLGLTGRYNNIRPGWNPEWTPLLGTKPDQVLAGELGIPVSTVKVQRVKLAIPTADAKLRRQVRRAALDSISDQALAGSLDDLMAAHGFSVYDLQAERKRRALRPRSARGRKTQRSLADLRAVAIVAIKQTYPDVTLEQIGQAIGVTRERARQVLYLAEVVTPDAGANGTWPWLTIPGSLTIDEAKGDRT